jgi:hypothetical protein
MSGGWKARRGIVIAVSVLVASLLAFTIGLTRRLLWHADVMPTPGPQIAGRRRIDVPPQKISATTPPVAPAAVPATGLQVCGLGRVLPTTADADNINEYVEGVTREAHDRWESTLLDSSESRARAVGLVIQSAEYRRSELPVQAEESRDELARLAATDKEPAVYALAVGLCRTYLSDPIAEGACARLSLSEWTQVDPDNAEPWIAVAQAARRNGDLSAEASAFEHAAAAHSMDNSSESLFSVGLREIPQDVTPLEKAAITTELFGYLAAWAQPGFREISEHCSAEALQDVKIHNECNAVAELMVDHRSTLLNSVMGARVGERVGWPAERVSQLRGEREAMIGFDPISHQEPWSCQSVSRLNAYMERRAQVGERAAIREQLEHSAEPAASR